MALFSGTGRFSLVQSYDLRKVREKTPSAVLRSEFKEERSESPRSTTLVEEETFVERVSVYSENDENGKTRFSVVLELDSELNPSNRTRRTEAVKGLALDVEEKELPGLCRLSGRRVEVLLERKISRLDYEKLAKENEDLKSEINALRRKNGALSEQLQFAMDQIRETS